MIDAITTVEASEATEKIASELTSGTIRHGAEMSRKLKVSKGSTHACVNVVFCGWDFRCSAVSSSLEP
jgi:hypothetical protein